MSRPLSIAEPALTGKTRVSTVANIDVEAQATIGERTFPAVSVRLTAEPQGFVQLRASLRLAHDDTAWRLDLPGIDLSDLFRLRDALNAAVDMALAAGINTAAWQDAETITHHEIPSVAA